MHHMIIIGERLRMATKTATLTVRIEPALKKLLKQAADNEHRSIANMVEVLIKRHADEQGLIPAQVDTQQDQEVSEISG